MSKFVSNSDEQRKETAEVCSHPSPAAASEKPVMSNVVSNSDEQRKEKETAEVCGHPSPAAASEKPERGKQKQTKKGRPEKPGDVPAPKRYTDVKELPEHLHRVVDRMLAEGSTFEDAVAAVKELEDGEITLAAVEIYFRSNMALQQDRVRRLQKTLTNLKSACANPESAQADLAETVLLMGLLGLKKTSATSDVQHAIRAKEQKENFRLKEDVFRLKLKRSGLESQLMKARLKADQAKLKLASAKLEQLKGVLERERGGASLTPEMLQRIQEVYGIVSDESGANSIEEPPPEEAGFASQ
jgi:hypothetical protein